MLWVPGSGVLVDLGAWIYSGVRRKSLKMNGLLAAMAIANPVITALLTIVVFLEKDKLRKRSEDLEAALNSGNQSVVQTIEAQKSDFTNIADRLEALSRDSEKSAATFIGLSTALTESSSISAKALGGVTEGLQAHATSVAALVTDLSKQVSDTSSAAIADLSTKNAESLKSVSDEIKKVEAAQVASKEASTQAIAELAIKTAESLKQIGEEIKRVEAAQTDSAKSTADSMAKLTQEVGQTSKSIKELQETLKSTVTL